MKSRGGGLSPGPASVGREVGRARGVGRGRGIITSPQPWPVEQSMAFCGPSEVDSPPTTVCVESSSADTQHCSMEKEFDFVERPSQDFFCPVSFKLLLEPQLTSCCGHHLSLEAATRLQREGKPCPMCNGEEWSFVLDKYHRRRVHDMRVRCWHKENGCEWVGEVNELKRHADSCVKRPWECQYCALKCTYGEGEGKHWPTCNKFPEPCPNGCEVGSVERCNMEQHRSVCSLEPVACEMKEFGCSVVVPRKELATHMRESELQHLTAMTMLNLRLCRQLQQDSTERDRKMTQLQEEMTKLHGTMLQVQTKQNKELREVKDHIIQTKHVSSHIEQHTMGEAHSVCKTITFVQYTRNKSRKVAVDSDPFYSHHHGYKFKPKAVYGYSPLMSIRNNVGIYVHLTKGEYDNDLCWPVEVQIHLELLNQAKDHSHIAKTCNVKWTRDKRDSLKEDAFLSVKYSDLEIQDKDVKYVINDCLKLRINITIYCARYTRHTVAAS